MKERILLIDDEKIIVDTLGGLLETGGYEADKAESGEMGMKLLKEHSYDTVICDIKMSKVSGIDVLKHVKDEFNTLPIIMLTGYIELDTAIRAMKIGAFDYLTKPVNFEVLIMAVKKAVEHKKLLEKNIQLEKENLEYQKNLEKKVELRTRQLKEKIKEVELAYTQLKKANLDSVKILAETIEAKDPYTRGHCNRVKNFSISIAKKLNLSKVEMEILEYGALLHDIGKIGIQGIILNKHERLTHEEYKHVMEHPVIGEKIIQDVDFFKPAIALIRNHHEHFDGGGYPDGLKGKDIPLFARIIAVADAYDAITSTRPYREKISSDKAISILKENRGSQFDPEIADIFVEIISTTSPT